MQRWMSRARGFMLATVVAAACSDDPATTAPPPPPPPEETDTADRAALIAFYNATNGRTHWDEKENWEHALDHQGLAGREDQLGRGSSRSWPCRATTSRERSRRSSATWPTCSGWS